MMKKIQLIDFISNCELNTRFWWLVRPSFTFSTLTTSQTTGNASTQVSILNHQTSFEREKTPPCCQTSSWPLAATITSVCLAQDFVSPTTKVSSGWAAVQSCCHQVLSRICPRCWKSTMWVWASAPPRFVVFGRNFPGFNGRSGGTRFPISF